MDGKFPDTHLSTQIFFSTLTLLQQRGASLEEHPSVLYTRQLFLSYKREIFILGVLGFLKTTRSFPKIPEEV